MPRLSFNYSLIASQAAEHFKHSATAKLKLPFDSGSAKAKLTLELLAKGLDRKSFQFRQEPDGLYLYINPSNYAVCEPPLELELHYPTQAPSKSGVLAPLNRPEPVVESGQLRYTLQGGHLISSLRIPTIELLHLYLAETLAKGCSAFQSYLLFSPPDSIPSWEFFPDSTGKYCFFPST